MFGLYRCDIYTPSKTSSSRKIYTQPQTDSLYVFSLNTYGVLPPDTVYTATRNHPKAVSHTGLLRMHVLLNKYFS